MGVETFGGMLRACADATGADAELVWISDDRLQGAGVRQWSEIPLWRTSPGVWQLDASQAQAAGLQSRPLAVTVADTWAWMRSAHTVLADERAAEIGISREREQAILAGLV
jgi:hypothetical protein